MEAFPTTAEPAAEAVAAEIPPPVHAPALPRSFAQMRLKVGDRVHVEPPRRIAGGRASATILGWIEGQSIIVSAPQNDAGRLVLTEREVVLLRAFNGKSAFAFRAAVLRLAYQPLPYLHLSFPHKVEGVDIRNSPRCRVRLPAVISAPGRKDQQGNILDIGTTGALIETAAPLDQREDLIRIAFSLQLHGIAVSLDLGAQLSGAKSAAPGGGPPHHRYGAKFRNLQPNDRLILGSLVWYQMYEHPHSAA